MPIADKTLFKNLAKFTQETQTMKALTTTVLVLAGCVSLDPVLAQPPKVATGGSSVVDTIKLIERDWANAMIVGDKDKLARAIADDYVELTGTGRTETKASFLTHAISAHKKLTAVEWGPEDVTVLGNVAVVQASATETWDADGQPSVTQIAFMDVYMKQGDSWLLVRSQTRPL